MAPTKALLPVLPAAFLWSLASTAAAQPADDCDRLAAHPFDSSRVTQAYVIRPDPETAIPACRAAIEAHPDTPRFAYQLGFALLVDGEEAEACAQFRNAAEKDYARAAFAWAGCLRRGTAVEKDDAASVHWFEQAAELGDGDAATVLCTRYAYGIGTDRDIDTAIPWCRKAVEAGDENACLHLGKFYLEGDGVTEDRDEAKRLFLLARDRAHELVTRFAETAWPSEIWFSFEYVAANMHLRVMDPAYSVPDDLLGQAERLHAKASQDARFDALYGEVLQLEGDRDRAFDAFLAATGVGNFNVTMSYQRALAAKGMWDAEPDGKMSDALKEKMKACIAADECWLWTQ